MNKIQAEAHVEQEDKENIADAEYWADQARNSARLSDKLALQAKAKAAWDKRFNAKLRYFERIRELTA